MDHSQNATTLDLHGRRMEEAVSEVTLFLERIRRAATAHSQGQRRMGEGGHDTFFVKIITGAGSHSSHGPILRSAVEKLLIKRGMTFKLERGGGAYHVDALSGCDLYNPGPATTSKVLTAEQEEFNHIAFALRKGNSSGNFASAAGMAQCTARARPTRTVSARNFQQPFRRSSSGPEPLPSQVASEENELRSAVRESVTENQKHRHRHDRETKKHEHEYQRALSESNLVQEVSKNIEEEAEESLRLAYEQSLKEEQRRQQLTEKQYEEELMRALEQSTQESSNEPILSEDEFMEQALAESRALAEAEKANNAADEDEIMRKIMAESLIGAIEEKNQRISLHHKQELVATELTKQYPDEEDDQSISEDDLIKQALAESRALAEAERTANTKDDALEKALAESLLLDEANNAAYEQEEELTTTESVGIDLLGEVMRLKQQEEDSMEEAIENSKNIHHGDVD